MKRLLATILAFVYLSTSMGATVHLHYCMGKLASWGLIDHESKNCEKCGMVKQNLALKCVTAKMSCCKDEHKQIKTDKDQQLSPTEFSKHNPLIQSIGVIDAGVQGISAFSVAIELPNSNAPPLSDKLPLFIRFCNFRL